MPVQRHKNFTFTLANYDDDQRTILREFSERNVCRYLVYQREVGRGGLHHLQGYLELKDAKTLTALKKSIGIHSLHLDQARDPDAARAYCIKEDTRLDGTQPIEYGTFKTRRPGRRTDLESVVEDIRDGASLTEIAQEHPLSFIRYTSGIQRLIAQISEVRDWKTRVEVYWGETGTGKTRKAATENPDAYWKPQDYGSGSCWWDTYDKHETVIIDEFYGWIPYSTMLRLLDRNQLLIQVKGAMSQFLARKIIITSNDPPHLWYKNLSAAQLKPLMRRIDLCLHFKSQTDIEEEQVYFEESNVLGNE